MAITIQLQPVSPRYSNGEIIYSVTSDLVGPGILPANIKQQYSFVCDIYKGTTRVQRFFKQPNPVGACVFDLSRYYQNDVNFDLAAIGAAANFPGVDAQEAYSVRFGEQYIEGTTLTIFNGSDVVGEPALSANTLTILKGTREYDVSALNVADTIPSVVSSTALLTEPIRVGTTDKRTITTWNGTTLVHNAVAIPNTAGAFTRTINSVDYDFVAYVDNNNLGDTRFAWFNRRGGIDYFTATELATTATSVSRATSKQPTINYGVTTPSNKIGSTYRSSTQTYEIDYDVMHTKNTGWLNRQQAEALEGLFDSPNVYVQVGADFRPVEILNGYMSYPTTRNQQNFSYPIEYRFSNSKRSI